jgi:hypothetical protein
MKQVKVPLNAEARRKFVEAHREALGIPADARVSINVRSTHIYAPPPVPALGESFDLRPNMSRLTSAKTEHYLIKLAWWQREANDILGLGTHRRYRTGATIVVTKRGRVRAFLHNPNTARTTTLRSQFLGRMLAGERATVGIGPDGVALQGGLCASLENDTLSIRGAMQALHVVGDVE